MEVTKMTRQLNTDCSASKLYESDAIKVEDRWVLTAVCDLLDMEGHDREATFESQYEGWPLLTENGVTSVLGVEAKDFQGRTFLYVRVMREPFDLWGNVRGSREDGFLLMPKGWTLFFRLGTRDTSRIKWSSLGIFIPPSSPFLTKPMKWFPNDCPGFRADRYEKVTA